MENPSKLYLRELEVSRLTRRALSTLRNDRHLRRGFPYIKLGRTVLYQKEDVIDFLNKRKVQTGDSIRRASNREEFLK